MNSEERLTKLLTDLFTTMPQYLNEKQRRLLAACVARSYGYGGISRIHSVSGISRVTIGEYSATRVPPIRTTDTTDPRQ